MDQQRFDDFARALSTYRSRRGLGSLAAGLLAVLGAGAVEAKNRRGKHHQNHKIDDVKASAKKKKKKSGSGKKKKGGSTGGGGTVPTRCAPTVSCVGVECGSFPDNGCGQVLNCGGCPANKSCTAGNVCVCAAECCSNADCASGRCSAGGACCAAADEVCSNAGAQCGTVSDPCGQVECGGCTGGEVCNQRNQCIEPCPNPGEVRCGGVCQAGVCCDDGDCPGGEVCTGGDSGTPTTCCRPEHSSATCFPTQGAPFCGWVDNNCGVSVPCGDCPSDQICAADNRCASCPNGTQPIKFDDGPSADVCCPDTSVCNPGGEPFCCGVFDDPEERRICCAGGTRCGLQPGDRCRPWAESDCCGSCEDTGTTNSEGQPVGICV